MLEKGGGGLFHCLFKNCGSNGAMQRKEKKKERKGSLVKNVNKMITPILTKDIKKRGGRGGGKKDHGWATFHLERK